MRRLLGKVTVLENCSEKCGAAGNTGCLRCRGIRTFDEAHVERPMPVRLRRRRPPERRAAEAGPAQVPDRRHLLRESACGRAGAWLPCFFWNNWRGEIVRRRKAP